MTVDLTGGLDPDREFVFDAQPDDPEMRESVNCWLWDASPDVGMPRIGVEAVADQWDTHDIQLNLAFADGRAFSMFGPGPVHDPSGADGRPRILGAGPLAFELVEPFTHWKLRVDGEAIATSSQAQIEGWAQGQGTGELVPVQLEIDLRHAVPPWETGTLLPEAGHVLATQEEGDLMGGPRFEQLFRATGTLTVGGESRPIDGGGLRIRRRGIRRLARFWGHCWQSALFPSGRGFGCLVYPPRDDGKPTFNEGFVFEGDGSLIPARVVDAPWLRRLLPSGDDTTVTLETADGTTTIEGSTAVTTFHPLPTGGERGIMLQQAICTYTWDDETANGMIERSSYSELIEGM